MKKKIILLLAMPLLLLFSLTARANSMQALLHQTNDPIAGNPNGTITIVEFFDYQCSHCISMAPIVASIIKNNPNVRVVFKELPIRGSLSDYAARAALAANKQGHYYSFSHALLTTQQPLTQDTILDMAKTAGLNVAKLKKDMQSKNVEEQLKANYNLALNLKLSGTPAFFISKTDETDGSHLNFVLGEMSQAELQRAIEQVA